MTYQGGKATIAKRLAGILQTYFDNAECGLFLEPFVGGNHILQHIKAPSKIASDSNEAMITFWKAVQDGWEPATEWLSPEEYVRLKATQDPKDPMTALAGVGCSFGGKWFGGYARSTKGAEYQGTNYMAVAMQQAKKQLDKDVLFLHVDYKDIIESWAGAFIYCDPPYRGTLKYNSNDFDSDAYYDVLRDAVSRGNFVACSEYSMPEDFRVAQTFEKRHCLDNRGLGHRVRTERLFLHESQYEQLTGEKLDNSTTFTFDDFRASTA